jgi:integration host factor subunit alpha
MYSHVIKIEQSVMIMHSTIPYLQKNTITREHLARAVKRSTGLNISKSSTIVDQIIELLSAAVASDKQIKIRLFGSFSTKQKSARVGRNPKTMAVADIPARKVVKFKVAPTLKKRINDNISSIS